VLGDTASSQTLSFILLGEWGRVRAHRFATGLSSVGRSQSEMSPPLGLQSRALRLNLFARNEVAGAIINPIEGV
jgi:hypothetical protein